MITVLERLDTWALGPVDLRTGELVITDSVTRDAVGDRIEIADVSYRCTEGGWKISKLLFEICWGERRADPTGYLELVGGRGPRS